MTDSTTVLIAAFGGGLAGAVLQPITGFVLARVDSNKAHDRRLARKLRQMVEANLQYGRRLLIANMLRQPDTAGPIPWDQIIETVKLEDVPNWLPERIKDEPLRQLATAHNDECMMLYILLTQVPTNEDHRETAAKRIDALAPEIIQRMDDLRWPEVEEPA
jgi:hypothetical protein